MALPLVTVVVPVYNTASGLARCIESVRRQSYGQLEIILIDDGSVDASGEICRMYARVDARIRVIHKQNEGVSAARNDAIAAARGKYLQFTDSDDVLAQDAVYRMVQRAEHDDCDLVIGAYRRIKGETTRVYAFLPEGEVMTKREFACSLMEEPASFYYGVLWNKLYRADVIARYQIRCNTALSWSEDFLFNLQYIRHAERFAALAQPVYDYIDRAASLTHTQLDLVNIVKVKTVLFQYYKQLYQSLGLYEQYRMQIYKYLIAVAEQ